MARLARLGGLQHVDNQKGIWHLTVDGRSSRTLICVVQLHGNHIITCITTFRLDSTFFLFSLVSLPSARLKSFNRPLYKRQSREGVVQFDLFPACLRESSG
jgi:hypothetical protein